LLVTAEDGTTKKYYKITVTVLVVGQSYGGGIVAYIDGTGVHGLIAAIADKDTVIVWHNSNSGTTGATATALGTGNANTNAIVALYGTESNAAKWCADYTNTETGTGVYSDWFLPSRDELDKLYDNRSAIGGFNTSERYWSSSEYSASQALRQSFIDGSIANRYKNSVYRVRAVRIF
jgi:hypothetical protein